MKRILLLIPVAVLLLFSIGTAQAQTGGGYSLGGTIGQADAGAASGGAYSLNGGFWAGVPAIYNAFVPIALR